jgi:bifunctional DNA-binding transcriptional regulator/antitoxin component of YhaV-PrlF toxin-antitoxin module
MTTLTITTKGQLTLRQDLIRHLGLRPGDKVEVDALPQGRIELRAARPAARIEGVFNLLRRPDAPALTLEQMTEIAAQGWSGRR